MTPSPQGAAPPLLASLADSHPRGQGCALPPPKAAPPNPCAFGAASKRGGKAATSAEMAGHTLRNGPISPTCSGNAAVALWRPGWASVGKLWAAWRASRSGLSPAVHRLVHTIPAQRGCPRLALRGGKGASPPLVYPAGANYFPQESIVSTLWMFPKCMVAP